MNIYKGYYKCDRDSTYWRLNIHVKFILKVISYDKNKAIVILLNIFLARNDVWKIYSRNLNSPQNDVEEKILGVKFL